MSDLQKTYEWRSNKNEDVIVPEQIATACYVNPFGQLVIRQERAWDEEDDPYLVISMENVPTLIERMQTLLQCHGPRSVPEEPDLRAKFAPPGANNVCDCPAGSDGQGVTARDAPATHKPTQATSSTEKENGNARHAGDAPNDSRKDSLGDPTGTPTGISKRTPDQSERLL